MLVKVLFEGEIIVSRDINEFIDFDVWTAKVIKDLDYVGLLFKLMIINNNSLFLFQSP